MANVGKRENVLKWDEAFMGFAFIAAQRSKEPVCQNGVFIINPATNHPKSMGYTGMPRLCSDDEFPWDDSDADPVKNKHSYCVHAELNAILNSDNDLNGCVLYLYSEKGFPPCSRCASAILQKGIKEVVCCSITSRKESTNFSWEPTKRMFAAAGVKMREMTNLSFLKKLAAGFLDAHKKMTDIREETEVISVKRKVKRHDRSVQK